MIKKKHNRDGSLRHCVFKKKNLLLEQPGKKKRGATARVEDQSQGEVDFSFYISPEEKWPQAGGGEGEGGETKNSHKLRGQ